MIDPRLEREEGEALLERMLRSIRHRGPDYSSSWVDMPVLLGHNRLRIIDLSDRANQPMAYDGLVIVYNGEVYNYLEIRAELEKGGYAFRTSSDTEVILAAYKKWGGDCVTRFVGMWAFAVWDSSKKELFCSRDRFGIKPFYYVHSGDRFYFASEYAPLKLSPVFSSEFDLEQMSRGLRLGVSCYKDQTYFQCMKSLPERSNLVFKGGKVAVVPYWDIDVASKFRGSFADKKRRLQELFRESVRLHMRSDVAVGGMLSGGMDSSSIASVVGSDFREVPFRTFTIYYQGQDEMDERVWTRDVVSTYPNIRPHYHAPSDREVAESFDAVMRAHEVPLNASTPVSCYFVMKLAAENQIRVLLDGQGADEFLAGYPPAFDRLIGGYLGRARWLKALKALRAVHRQRSLGFGDAGQMALKAVAAAMLSEEAVWSGRSRFQYAAMTVENLSSDVPKFRGSRLNQYLYHLLFHTFLPSLLHYGDRMSMAFSIECRVPFLDHRLVEFAFALDDEDKIREGQSKYILRQAMRGIVPEAILNRQEKQPFVGQEMASWLNGPLKHLIEPPMSFDGIDVVNEKEARRAVQAFREGDRRKIWLVWRLAMLHHWVKSQ